MTAKKIDKKILIVASAVILLAVFVPWNRASADLFGIGSIATDAVYSMLVGVLYAIFSIIGTFLGWIAKDVVGGLILISTSQYPDAVQASWSIVKNFVNMFFILALIIMAGATIFDVKNYNYEKLLVPFLIIAVLINFSFAITNYIVSVGNGLTGVMVNQIGDVGGRLGEGFGLVFNSTISGNAKAASLASTAATYVQTMMALIFGIIFAAIALLALVASALFIIARTVIIWILLIVAPIAWFCYIFPGLRKNWSKWWDYLISWTFFLPVYLFFLSFAFIFLNQANNFQAGKLADRAIGGSSGIMTVMSGGFNTLIFYCVTIFFMVYGLKAAFDVGSLASNGVKGAFGEIEDGIKKYSGYQSRAEGVKAGFKAWKEEKEEKGIFGIGGAQSARLRTAKWAEIFGVKGAGDRARDTEIQKEVSDYRKRNPGFTQKSLEEDLNKSSGVKKLALSRLNADMGWETDLSRINQVLKDLGGGNTVAGSAYINSLKKSDFNKIYGGVAAKTSAADNINTDQQLRKALYEDMAKNNEVLTQVAAEKMLDLFSADSKEIQDKIVENLKNNIKDFNIADKKGILNTSTNKKLKEATAKVMLENGDLTNAEIYNSAASQIGTTGSVELAKFEKTARSKNIHLDQELDYRTAGGLPSTGAITDPQRSDVTRKIETELGSMSNEELKALTPTEILTPEVHQAIRNGAIGTIYGPTVKEMMKSADKKKRKAIIKALNVNQTEFAYT